MGQGRALTLVFSVALLWASCTNKPSEPIREVRLADRTLHEVTTLRALPASVQKTIGVGKPGLEGIADRGDRYNSTDVILFNWPMRRFAVAGLDNDFALVAVEHGGRGWHVDILQFSEIGAKAKLVQRWIPLTTDAPRTLPEMLNALRSVGASDEAPDWD
jgi:hypothetical protein